MKKILLLGLALSLCLCLVSCKDAGNNVSSGGAGAETSSKGPISGDNNSDISGGNAIETPEDVFEDFYESSKPGNTSSGAQTSSDKQEGSSSDKAPGSSSSQKPAESGSSSSSSSSASTSTSSSQSNINSSSSSSSSNSSEGSSSAETSSESQNKPIETPDDIF